MKFFVDNFCLETVRRFKAELEFKQLIVWEFCLQGCFGMGYLEACLLKTIQFSVAFPVILSCVDEWNMFGFFLNLFDLGLTLQVCVLAIV